MAVSCNHCDLDFEKLRLTVKVGELLDDRLKGLDGDRVRLFCPGCGTESWIDLRPHGVFHRAANGEQKLYRWRSARARSLTIGSDIHISPTFTLSVPVNRIEILSEKEICYPRVPVFREMNGSLSIPHWPVKPEYLEFIDTTAEARPEIVRDEYHIELPVKGMRERLEISLPLVPVKNDRAASTATGTFEGIHLALWPKVPYKEWKRFFLRLGCAPDQAENISNSSRKVKVFAYASNELGSRKKEWVPISALAGDGVTLLGCVESWPEWIAIEFENTSRNETVGGGIWQVTFRSQEVYPEHITGTRIAVDFGTSNTCMALEGDGDTPFISIESNEDFIIHGSDLPSTVAFADTWPPRQGFGKSNALLPSELLTREGLENVRIHAERISQWKPVVDYGIPTAGVKVEFDEGKHILAEFKWDQMIRDVVLRSSAQELQKRYLEFVLLFALAQLAKDRRIGKNIYTKFSYPLAFDKEQREKFEKVLQDCAEKVGMMTGLRIEQTLQTDEARAAASSAKPAGKKAFLYVDVGGGSSDIALAISRIDSRKEEYYEYQYIASFQYAGGALVDALDGGNCLATSASSFRRMIREVGQVKEMLDRGNAFHPHKGGQINAKTAYFYGYLLEFLSRLLAAHIITGEYKTGMPDNEIELVLNSNYQVALYPLGNGWGFGHLFDPEYARAIFATDLTDRTNEIIREAVDIDPSTLLPQVEVDVPEGLGSSDPKRAVVLGLLRGESERRSGKKDDWAFRTILGCTTQVGTARSVPWYLPVTNLGLRPPKGQEELPLATLDCPKDEWPSFHRRLITPHELDPGLNKIRNDLSKCLGPVNRWFILSPFHVMLEKLFKPKLKELL
jgi:hypothetical protein